MITGFDEETAPLNDIEKRACDIIADTMLRFHIGEGAAVSATTIAQGLAKSYNIFAKDGKPYLTGPRIRKIMNHLRTHDIVPLMVASSKGYYVAKEPSSIRDYIRSLRERSNAITNVADALQRQLNHQFAGTPAATIPIKV